MHMFLQLLFCFYNLMTSESISHQCSFPLCGCTTVFLLLLVTEIVQSFTIIHRLKGTPSMCTVLQVWSVGYNPTERRTRKVLIVTAASTAKSQGGFHFHYQVREHSWHTGLSAWHKSWSPYASLEGEPKAYPCFPLLFILTSFSKGLLSFSHYSEGAFYILGILIL